MSSLYIYLYTPAFTPVANAAANNTINFQARLLTNTGALVPDGYYNAEFKLYDASSGGTLLWTDTRYDTNGVTAGNDYRIQVKNGYLTVSLGDTTAGGTAFPGTIDWSQELWLSMNIGGTTQTATPTWNGEMSPRMKVTAVPYAFAAKEAQQLKVTNGANTTTISVTAPTANRTITFPNASGTVAVSASGNIALDSAGNVTFSGQLPIANGGTGASTQQAAINALSGLTTNGDLLYHNGTNSTRLARGSNGQCLTSNATTILWGSCGGGGTTLQGAYDGDADGSDSIITLGSADDSLIFRNPASSGTDSAFTLKVEQLNTGSGVDALVVSNSGTSNILNLQNAGTKVLSVDSNGNLLGNGAATGTTGTTEATARTNVTTVTLTAAGSFANNDVIFINNAGQDYYTRIVSGGGTTTLTVSPAVSYDVSATVTKYNVQNIGATTTDYTTQSNRFFQGYFLGGVVTGAGSTVYSDGMIAAGPGLTVKNPSNSTTAFRIQDTSGTNIFTTDTTNQRIGINTSSPTAPLSVGISSASSTFTTGFESGSLAPFTQSGGQNINGWAIDSVGANAHSGTYSARASITQTSPLPVELSLSKTLTSAGNITFWMNKSYYTCITFYIDGVGQQTWNSGGNAWAQYSFAVGSGTHTLKWSATCGDAGTAIWLDDITLTNVAASNQVAALEGSVAINSSYTKPNFVLDINTGSSSSTLWAGVASSSSTELQGGLLLHQNLTYGFQQATKNTGSSSNGQLVFDYRNLSDGSVSKANILTLQANGNVGVGTANPSNLLHVALPSGGDYVNGFESGALAPFTQTAGSNTWVVDGNTVHSGGSSAHAYSADGNATTKLEITKTLTTSGTISFWMWKNYWTGMSFEIDGVVIDHWNSGANYWNYTSHNISAGTHTFSWYGTGGDPTTSFFIDDVTITNVVGSSVSASFDGSVGIGTTSPTARLQVSGSNTTTALQVQNSNGVSVVNIDTTNGEVEVGSYNGGTNPVNGKIVFNNSTNANTVGIISGATSSSYTLTLPTSVGSANQCLQNSGTAGVLTFASCDPGGGTTLQGAYTASTGGTTSEIILDTTRGGVDIQDRSTSNGGTIGSGALLFALRATAANDTTLGSALFSVDNTGKTVFQNTADTTGAFQIKTASGTSLLNIDTLWGSTPSFKLGISATAGFVQGYSSLAGPTVLVSGGSNNELRVGPTTSSWGNIEITANINSSPVTSAVAIYGLGTLTSQSGNGSNSMNIFKIHNINFTGGVTTGTTGQTAGSGGAIVLETGTGGAATGASGANTGGAGGAFSVLTANGGNATSGTGGAGGDITLTAGNGGNGSTSGGRGGNITLAGGSVGTGGTPTAGSVRVKNTTNSTIAFQVQNTSSTAVLAVDTTNQTVKVRSLSDAATLGSNLFSNSCTGANWSGSNPYTHTAGSTAALTCTIPSITASATYEVAYTTAGTTAGEYYIPSMGGGNGPRIYGNATGTVVINTTTTANMTITPTSAQTGTFTITSVKLVTNASKPLAVLDSTGATQLEVRATTYNTGLGLYSLQSNTTGSRNTGVGNIALQSNTTGSDNIAIGYAALQYNTTGASNVATGSYALYANNTGSNNTATGQNALSSNYSGSSNSAFGSAALQTNNVGTLNTAIGASALSANTSGSNNTAVGYASQSSGTTTSNNTSVGYNSLQNATGSYNTAVGASTFTGTISGVNNTALGFNAGTSNGGFTQVTNVDNATAIGAYALVQASNSLVLGQITTPTKVGIGTTIPLNTFSVSPVDYAVGTISQTASTTVVGSGTTFTSAMVGDQLIYADGTTDTVTGFTDATHITVTTSRTHASSAYRLHHIGLQVASNGTTYAQGNNAAQLQVKNGSSKNVLTVDSANGQLIIGDGTASGVTGKLVLQNSGQGSTNAVTIQSANQSNALTLNIPANVNSSDTFCLLTLNNCTGSSTTLQGAYDADTDGSDSIITLGAADDSLIFRNPASSGTDSTFTLKVEQLNTGSGVDALVVSNSGTSNILNLQNAGTKVLSVDSNGNLLGNGAATGTTGTTEANARANVTTVTLTAAGSFANNDVIFINNAGQDYYTRIVSGGGTTTLTVSPAVSYDASATVTKYTVQNIGASTTDYTTQSNRFFQGYFLGGVVTGAGSTTLSDGNITSSNGLKLQASSGVLINSPTDITTALQVQNTTGGNVLSVGTSNNQVNIGASSALTFNDPMTSTPNGTMTNNATYIAGSYVRLTDGGMFSNSGQISYTDASTTNYDTNFQYYTTGGTDDVFWFSHATTTPTTPSAASGGYKVDINQAVPSGSGTINLYYDNTLVTSATGFSPTSGQWHDVRIVLSGTRIKVYYDSSLIMDYTDIPRSLSGTKFGFGGYVGGYFTGSARVRNFTMNSTSGGVVGNVGLNVYGTGKIQSSTNSTTAFQVQNADAANILTVNSVDRSFILGASTSPGLTNNSINDTYTSTPSGSLNNSATYVSGQYIQLTNGGSMSGQVEYTPSLESDFDATFQFYTSGNATSVSLYAYNTSTPGFEGSATGGYEVAYNEWDGQVKLYWNGSVINSVAASGFNNSAWHDARVVKSGNNIKAYLDGVLKIDYNDTTRVLSGTKFGLQGSSNVVGGTHRVRNLSLNWTTVTPGSSPVLNINTATGQAIFQSSTNSTTAFQIQNASAKNVMTTDTTNGKLIIGDGAIGGINGALVIQNAGQSSTNAVTIVSANQSNAVTLTIPANANSTDTFCLATLANCAGGSLQASYNASTGGTTPEIKLDSTRTALDIQDANSTINGQLLVVRGSNGSGLGSSLFEVKSNGQVGIGGAPSTNVNLHVKGSGDTILAVERAGGMYAGLLSGTSGSTFNFNAAGNFYINPASSIDDASIDSQHNLTFTGGGTYSKLGVNNTGPNAIVDINGDGSSLLNVADAGTSVLSVADQGAIIAKNKANSTSAFSLQNANSVNILNIDTTNGELEVGSYNGGTNPVNGKLVVNNSTNANTVTIVSGATSSSYTLTLPTALGASGDCLKDTSGTGVLGFTSCGGGAGGLAKDAMDTSSASVTAAGYLYGFTNSNSAVASGVLSLDNGTNTGNTLRVTTSGNPTTGLIFASNTNASPSGNLLDLQSGSSPTSKFSVTAAGAVTAAGLVQGNLGLTVTGAAVSLNAGSGFNTSINTGSAAGNVTIGSSNVGSSVTVTGGANATGITLAVTSGTNAAVGNIGGSMTLTTGNGGNGTSTSGGNAGSFSVTAGNGGSANNGLGGLAGTISLTAGNGGPTAVGATGRSGGAITLTAGNGGNGTTNAGNGGAIILKAGLKGTTGGAEVDGDINTQNRNFNVKDIAGTNTILSVATGGARGLVSVALGNTASTAALCTSLANATAPTANVLYELRDCSAAPAADYAEMYPVAPGASYGDIVAVGTTMVNTYGELNGAVDWNSVIGQVTQLVKTNQAYQQNVIGIVSNNYGDFTSAGHNIKSQDNPMPVALNGRVPVKIAASSEVINPGDYITTSAVEPGKGEKALAAGIVIGKALETWSPTSGKTTVMVYVEQGYYPGPSTAQTLQGTGLNVTGNAMITGNLSIDTNLNVSGATTLDTLTVTGSAVFTGTLTVQNINVANITVNGKIITAGNTPSATVGVAAGTEDILNNIAAPTVTITGNDTSGTITIVAGANTTAGNVAELVFDVPFTGTPRAIVSAKNANSASLQIFNSTQLDKLLLTSITAPTPGQTYQFDYIIVQ